MMNVGDIDHPTRCLVLGYGGPLVLCSPDLITLLLKYLKAKEYTPGKGEFWL